MVIQRLGGHWVPFLLLPDPGLFLLCHNNGTLINGSDLRDKQPSDIIEYLLSVLWWLRAMACELDYLSSNL